MDGSKLITVHMNGWLFPRKYVMNQLSIGYIGYGRANRVVFTGVIKLLQKPTREKPQV